MLIYCYFNKEIYINWCFVDVIKIHPTLQGTAHVLNKFNRRLFSQDIVLCSVYIGIQYMNTCNTYFYR